MEDSDEEDFAVSLHDGRISGSAGACDTAATTWDSLLSFRGESLARMREAALHAAWPLANGSFWLPATASPANILEELAMRVYKFHVSSALPPGIDEAECGCEWWANVTRSELLKKAECGDIGFHFDKDERAYSDYGLVVHPLLSTVTYLTDDGAPTCLLPVVLSHATATDSDYKVDCEAGRLASASALASEDALVVPPRVGRHLRFDGRWLHGAPAMMRAGPAAGSDASDAYERITFCVNVWIGHRPRQLRRFESTATALPCEEGAAVRFRLGAARAAPPGGPSSTLQVRAGSAAPNKVTKSQQGDESAAGATTLRFALEQTSVAHELSLRSPPRLVELLRRGCVVHLRGGVEVRHAEEESEALVVAPTEVAASVTQAHGGGRGELDGRPRKRSKR